jgi:outer membrane protein assembly factor BamB
VIKADHVAQNPSAAPDRSKRRARLPLALATLILMGVPGAVRAAAPEGGDTQRLVLPGSLAAESEAQALDRLIERAEWDRVLPALQDFLDEPAGRMAWDGQVYLGLRELARNRLAALPDEAIEAYRLLYDPLAGEALADGLSRRDLSLLADTAERYPACRAAPNAAAGAAAILMDEGRYGEALRVVRRAREFAPAGESAAPLAVRELSCLLRLSRREEAEALVVRLEDSSLPRPVIAGEARAWRAVAAAPITRAEDGQQAAIPVGPERLAPQVVELNWTRRVDPQWPSVPSTQPVAGSGRIFVNRDGGIISLDAETHQVKWSSGPPGLAAELAIGVYEGRPSDEDMLAPNMPVGNIHHWRTYDNHGLAALTHAAGRLYALAFDPLWVDFTGMPWTATQDDIRLTNELRCCNARDGRMLWRVGGGQHGPVPELRGAWYFTAPCVTSGRAYVLAAYKGELYAVCLDAGTGEPVWTRLIGSIASRAETERYAMELFLADCCPPAIADGIAVFPTGHGLVWACTEEDGRPLWARPYDRAETWVSRLGRRISVPSGPWAPSRPSVAGNLCLLTPMDSREVLALRLNTGSEAWHAEFVDGQALLGVSEGRVLVQHTGLTCLDLTDGRRLWTAPAFAEPSGIGALAWGMALLPEAGAIRMLSLEDGSEQGHMDGPAGLAALGNLLVWNGIAVACSPDRFVVFAPEGPTEEPAGPTFTAATVTADLARYLDAGAGLVPGPLGGEQSAWTVLAEKIRRACRRDPEFRGAWQDAYRGRIGDAVARQDDALLARLAEWAPLREDRALALEHLERGGGRPAPRSAAALEPLPTGQILWEVPGLLVPSVRKGGDPDEGMVFVVRGRQLAALNCATGDPVWAARLPYPNVTPAASPGILGAGGLFHAATDRGLLFVLPDLAFMLDPTDGALQWSRGLPALPEVPRIVAPTPRFDAIQWLRRGRPADTSPLPEVRARRMDVEVGDEWLVRWGDGLPAQAVRVEDGLLVELAPAGVRDERDPQAAFAGTRLCLLDAQRNLLSVFPEPGAHEAAVWHLPRPDGEWSLRATRGGLAILNDLEKILIVEAVGLRPVSSWRTAVGIRDVLFASDEAVVVALQDGWARAFPPQAPKAGPVFPAGGGLRPEWADVSRGTVVLIQGEPAGPPAVRNQRAAIAGEPSVVQAADLATGRMLWLRSSPEQAIGGMPAPLRAGDFYVLCFAGGDAARVLAIEPALGGVAFALRVPDLAGSTVSQIDAAGGRLIFSGDMRTLAFGARPGAEAR